MINIKSVVNRSISGAIAGGSMSGAVGSLVGGIANMAGGLNLFGGFGNMYSGNAYQTGGKVVTLGFKSGHPYSGYPGVLAPLSRTKGLAFPYRPTIEISRAVNYNSNTPVHSMQDYRSFQGNQAATIFITGQLSAQSIEEGRYLQACLHFISTASLMSFGKGGAVPAGMPPPVLNLTAYGPNNLNNIPVVLDSIMRSYPNDVDYISVDGNEVPTVMTVALNMTVMLSPDQLRGFSLDAFASGNMQGYI